MLLINNHTPATRPGLSLVEVLIAMVMTLVVLGAMMAAFAFGSNEMQKGRAIIELNNRLINAEEQLRRDLDRITVELRPFQQATTFPKGYVEIIDGPETDNPNGIRNLPVNATDTIFGDRDDYFACTIKSDGTPFRGRFQGQIVESNLAEVIWFTVPDTNTADLTDVLLVRRQLLILPSASPTGGLAAFLQNNDVSVRLDGASLVANSLNDLAIRGNRFAHNNNALPSTSTLQNAATLGSLFNADHVMASAVAAFDVQVFAADATVRAISSGGRIVDVIEPSDVGTGLGAALDAGAYVDLGKGTGFFGGSPTAAYSGEAVYDTGTPFYNRSGINNRASNGVDDDSNGVVDGISEQIAIAPYNAPIRGLQFKMRVFEPVTKQVRQLSVKKSFVPES